MQSSFPPRSAANVLALIQEFSRVAQRPPAGVCSERRSREQIK
jgi:hypothetical protein